MTGIHLGNLDIYYQTTLMMDAFQRRMRFINLKNETEESVEKIIKEVNPDYIITTPSYPFRKSLSRFKVPVIIGVGDIWQRLNDDSLYKFVRYHRIKGIEVDCKCAIDAYRYYLDGLDCDFFWKKWGLDLNVLKDYGLPKVYDVMFSGKFSTYAYRRELNKKLLQTYDIRFRNYLPYSTSGIPYKHYAKNINRSWIGIGGMVQNKQNLFWRGRFIGYTFPRTLEIPAAGTCLINCHWGDEKVLGFRDGKNCILFTTIKDAMEKIRYYLDDKEELKKITKAGYELVHKNHDIYEIVDKYVNELEDKYGR